MSGIAWQNVCSTQTMLDNSKFVLHLVTHFIRQKVFQHTNHQIIPIIPTMIPIEGWHFVPPPLAGLTLTWKEPILWFGAIHIKYMGVKNLHIPKVLIGVVERCGGSWIEFSLPDDEQDLSIILEWIHDEN